MRLPKAGTFTVAGILLLAAFVRLYRIDLCWFGVDQVRDVSAASSIAAGQSLPLVGPNVGWTSAHLGPLYFYVIALPFAVSRDPLAGVVFVALANVLAVFLLYRLARNLFGVPTALISSALFAVFPLAVISSRALWNPGLLPLFTLLLISALCDLIVHRRSYAMVWLLALIAVVTQIHLAAIALAAVAGLAVGIFRPKVERRHVLIGLLLFLVVWGPYLFHELTHRFENGRALLFGPAGEPPLVWRATLRALVESLSALYQPVLGGFIMNVPWSPAFLDLFSILYRAESLLFVLGILVALYQLVRGITVHTSAILLLWTFVPVLLLARVRTVNWYYLDVLYPVQFLFVGLAVSTLQSLAGRIRWIVTWTLAGVVFALVLIQGSFDVGLQQRIARQGTIEFEAGRLLFGPLSSSPAVFTTLPYGYRLELVRTLVNDLGVTESLFPYRVHGSALGSLEENRYLMRYVATRSERPAAPPVGTHFIVARDWSTTSGPKPIRSRQIGPYTIVEYSPTIDYDSSKYAVVPRDSFEEPRNGWVPLPLPGTNLNLHVGEGEVLAWTTRVRIRDGAASGRMTVSVNSGLGLTKIDCWLSGRRLPSRFEQRTLGMLLFWTNETVFDLPNGWRPGDHALVIVIANSGPVFGVDVYEGGRTHDSDLARR